MNGVTRTGGCHAAKYQQGRQCAREDSQTKMKCQVPLNTKYQVSSQYA